MDHNLYLMASLSKVARSIEMPKHSDWNTR